MQWENLSYIAALITAVVGLILAESIRRRNNADTAESLSSAARNIVESIESANKELKHENSVLRLYVQYLLTGINQLRIQLGKEMPVFTPKSLDDFK